MLAYNVNEVESDHKKIFNYILNEYTKLTNIDQLTAEDYYNQIESNIYIEDHEEYEDYIKDSIYANQFLNEYDLELTSKEDIIVYIQENYSEICSNFSKSEKENFDKYLLSTSIEYYNEN